MNDHISLKKVRYLRGTCTWCYFARKHILLCPRRYLTFLYNNTDLIAAKLKQ